MKEKKILLNEDLSFLSASFPTDSADFYTTQYKNFWKKADASNEFPSANTDSYIDVKLGVWIYPIVQYTEYETKNHKILNIKSKELISSGNKFFIIFQQDSN